MKRDLKTNHNNKKPREIDPLDYDFTLDIHGDPIRSPPTSHEYKNNDGEWNYIADAYWIGQVKKDRLKAYSGCLEMFNDYKRYERYWQMWNEYTQTNTYKRKQEAYARYKERLKTCKTKEDFLQALMDYKKEKNISKENK